MFFKGKNGSCHQLWYNGCTNSNQCCSEYCFKGNNEDWEFGVCNPKINSTKSIKIFENITEST